MALNNREIAGIGVFAFLAGFAFGKYAGDKAAAEAKKDLEQYVRDTNLNRQIQDCLNRGNNNNNGFNDNSGNTNTIYGNTDHLF